MKVLPKDFYERDPALVAKELLGKILVRRLGSEVLSGKIVETEAYYGKNDPASRAYTGRKIFNELMFLDVGKAFIYMVHANWLLNIVAHLKNDVGANRKVEDIRNLTSGPGKLTKALAITKEQNGIDVTEISSELTITEGKMESFEIGTSHRIGVKNDLPRELRFFVKGNKFVSKFS